MAKATRNAWAMKHYMDQGWNMEVVERVVKVGKKAISFDFFGFGDLYGFKGMDHLIIQVTEYSNHSHRLTKVLKHPNARLWVMSSPHNAIHVISIDSKGYTKKKGKIRVTDVTPANFV